MKRTLRLLIAAALIAAAVIVADISTAGAINFATCYVGNGDISAGATNLGPPATGYKVVKRAAGADKCGGVTYAGSLYAVRRGGVNLFALKPSGAELLRANAATAGSLRWAAAHVTGALPNVLIWPEGGTTRMSPAEANALAAKFDVACGASC